MWPWHIYCLPEAASPPCTLFVHVCLFVCLWVPVHVREFYVPPFASPYTFQVHLGVGSASVPFLVKGVVCACVCMCVRVCPSLFQP